ncbi:MAG: OmpA family protein [Bryobacteraceae bacterium]|nr:OmpA family protein [Bryobacteraceae bacterium]
MGFAGIIVVLVFFIVCIPFSAFRIESDIYQRVREALLVELLPAAGLMVEGRDVFLTGPIPSREMKARAERTAWSVYGVRRVRNFLVVQDPLRRAALAREAQNELDALLRNQRIDFAEQSDALEPGSRVVLDRVAAVLNKYAEVSLDIAVHTEWVGGARRAVQLSERRAAAIVAHLRDKGVSETRLAWVGVGSNKPLAPHSTTEGRVLNPRVELNVK